MLVLTVNRDVGGKNFIEVDGPCRIYLVEVKDYTKVRVGFIGPRSTNIIRSDARLDAQGQIRKRQR